MEAHRRELAELKKALVSKDEEVAEKVSSVSAALKLQFNATIKCLTEAKEAAPPSMEACVALAVTSEMGGVSEDDSSQAQLGGATGCARSWRWQGVPRERAPEREHTGGAAATDTREANDSTAPAPAVRALAPLPLETWGESAQWKQESRTRYIKLCVPFSAYQFPSLHNFIMACCRKRGVSRV